MNVSTMIKTGALATAIVVATAGASFAATAYVDHNSSVRHNHSNVSPIVNWVSAGDHVKILSHWGNWYKIKIPGQDGWVKSSVLDFSYGGFGGGFGGGTPGVQACFGGPNGYFCING